MEDDHHNSNHCTSKTITNVKRCGADNDNDNKSSDSNSSNSSCCNIMSCNV